MKNIEIRNEKILKKVLSLMDKGYELDYCLKKYPEHATQIKEYYNIIDNFENLKGIKAGYSARSELFSKIVRGKMISETFSENNKAENAIPEKKKGFSEKEVALPVKIRNRYLKPVLAFCLSFVFIMFAFTGSVFASEKTLPGDALYPVKITAEKMQTFLYPESKRGKLYFNFLNKRISEADRLIENEINPDDENFIFILTEIEKQYNNCKRYGYFDNGDSQVMEQIKQIRRHGLMDNGDTQINSETEENSLDNESETTYDTEDCMQNPENYRNGEKQNKETNKKSMGNNGKN